jgi:hypothetical protein
MSKRKSKRRKSKRPIKTDATGIPTGKLARLPQMLVDGSPPALSTISSALRGGLLLTLITPEGSDDEGDLGFLPLAENVPGLQRE